jgi:phage terminase large subunit-like protein
VSKLKNQSPARARRSPTSRICPSTDFVAIAIGYAEEVCEDTRGKWTGKRLRQACRRYLKDLNRALAKSPPFLFSARKANAHCAFIEQLPHVEGEWNTENITLEPAQIWFVVQLFGFRKLDGTRRFTQAAFVTARKNAKSTLAAGIMVSAMALEPEAGAQLLNAATTGDQARIVWKIAKAMIDKRPDLKATFDIETFANSIARYDTGASYRPINARASTQDGLNPSHTNLDEVHALKNSDLMNVLKSAAGARKNPLWLYTTTEGYETPGPWPELRAFCYRILDGTVKADHVLACFWMMDDDDDELDDTKWVKANPLMHVNPIILEEMTKLAIDAANMPSVRAEFRIKRCNLPASSAKSWCIMRKWNRCAQPVDLDMLAAKAEGCWGGLDLASTLDMTAWRLLWLLEGHWYTWGRYWVPDDQVKQRTEAGRQSYAGWVEAGNLTRTPGDSTDYDAIYADVLADVQRFHPRKVGYDPWNASSLVNKLALEDVPLEAFVQGFKSYNPAMKECERAYVNGLLHHGGDPILRWNVSNVVPAYDTNLSIKPDRKRSADKIDGACALFMGFGVALAEEDEGDQDGFFSKPIRSSGARK